MLRWLAPAAFMAAAPAPLAHGPVYSGMPPERFQGDGVAVVIFTSDVAAFCGQSEPGTRRVACATKSEDGVPIMVLPNPCPIGDVEVFARLACHEGGHAQGWTGNHEF